MKRTILCTLTLMTISILCLGQAVTQAPHDSLTKIYVDSIDQEAKFPGGDEAWIKYLRKKLKIDLPVKNGAPDGIYKVIVKFLVSIDGTLSDFAAENKFWLRNGRRSN